MKRHLLSLSLIALLAPASLAAPIESPSAADLLGRLLATNDRYVREHRPQDFEHFQQQQSPGITMLGCSDSRAHSHSFVEDPTNQIFSVRNIGNQLQNSFGSVDYGVHHLHTPILLIMGHTHCGAIHAALENYAEESFAVIREIDHLTIPLRPLFRRQLPEPQDTLGFESIWAEATERNVDYQVKVALRRYQPEIAAGRLTVVGAVYDFIDAYGAGQGRLVLVNL
ncbi:MAG: hypothetical protein CVV27_16670, partial [Candidatus Melainabacteria bacterium HGW-Melainabacteria-1]